MSDPYVWIDPFAEIARWQRVSENMFEDGRRQVLRQVAGNASRSFNRALDDAVYRCANKIVGEQVMTWAQAHVPVVKDLDARARAEMDVLLRSARPMVDAVRSQASVDVGATYFPDKDESVFRVEFEVKPPFRVATSFVTNPSAAR